MSEKKGQPVRVSFGKKLLLTELVLYIISTRYKKIRDLFCLDIFLDFRTVWPPHLFVCGPSPAVEKRALSYWLGPWSLPVSMYGRLRHGAERRRRRRWLERRRTRAVCALQLDASTIFYYSGSGPATWFFFFAFSDPAYIRFFSNKFRF